MSTTKPSGIALLVPSSGRHVCLEWAMAIASLSYPVGMNHFFYASKADPDAGFTRDKQREKLAEFAIQTNTEFMMWVDDDTVPPAAAILYLYYEMVKNPNAAIVAGIYCTKEDRPSPIVFKELGDGPFWDWTFGDVFPCKGVGTGCMLVRTSIMKHIPKPWFQDTSSSTLGETRDLNGVEIKVVGHSGTDDTYFCQKVTDAGYDILAHGGVLPVHYDYATGKGYKIPADSYPSTSYADKLAAVNAQLPADKQRKLL